MASTASKTAEATVRQTAKSVEQQRRKVAETAQDFKHSSARIEESADRTTADRTTRGGAAREHADAPHALGLLRASCERPNRCSTAQNTEKFPPLHARPVGQEAVSYRLK